MQLDITNLEFIDPLLRSMALDVESHYGVSFTVTSIYRIDDNGVHGQLPVRGLDLRCRDELFGDLICTYVNAKYLYDASRPEMKCCMYHDVGLGAHIHLQVHNNTEMF